MFRGMYKSWLDGYLRQPCNNDYGFIAYLYTYSQTCAHVHMYIYSIHVTFMHSWIVCSWNVSCHKELQVQRGVLKVLHIVSAWYSCLAVRDPPPPTTATIFYTNVCVNFQIAPWKWLVTKELSMEKGWTTLQHTIAALNLWCCACLCAFPHLLY